MVLHDGRRRLFCIASEMIRFSANALVTQGQLAWRAVAARVAARTRCVVVMAAMAVMVAFVTPVSSAGA